MRWVLFWLPLAAWLACSREPAAPGAPTTEPAPAEPVASDVVDAGDVPRPGEATATVQQDAVVARVVDRGPIGHGQCTQCSYEVVIEERISGEIAAGPDPVWVHYERCDDAPGPEPGSVEPCSLEKGTVYELTLRRDASENFGSDPMIMRVRAH